MKYLITGAGGFIGKCLVKELSNSNDNELFLIKHHSDIILPPKYSAKITIIQYTGGYDSLNKVPKDIDCIIHLATVYHVTNTIEEIDSIYDTNIKFGVHLLQKMIENKIQNFINIASYIENNPKNLYALSKKLFRDILQYYSKFHSIKSISLDLHHVYGIGQIRTRQGFIDSLFQALYKNIPFKISNGNQKIAYVHIMDVVSAIIIAAKLIQDKKANCNEIYSVIGSEVLTLKEVVEVCFNTLDRSIRVEYDFYRDKEGVNELNLYHTILPTWSPKITLKEGLKEKWDKYNGNN